MGNPHRCVHPNGNLEINLRHLKERALFVLQETLPEFFQIGLVTNVDKFTGAPIRTSILPLSLVPGPNQKFPSHEEPTNAGVESVYSPQVKLEYTPSALPTPFPRVLHVEGTYWTLNTAVTLNHVCRLSSIPRFCIVLAPHNERIVFRFSGDINEDFL